MLHAAEPSSLPQLEALVSGHHLRWGSQLTFKLVVNGQAVPLWRRGGTPSLD
jgi:hypothetical protein